MLCLPDAYLVTACRPAQRLVFGANVLMDEARVDIFPDGESRFAIFMEHVLLCLAERDRVAVCLIN